MILSALKKKYLFEYNKQQVQPLLHQKNTHSLYTIGPTGWEVCVSNPEDVKQILFKLDTLSFKYLVGDNTFITNGHDWKTQRSIVSPALYRSMSVNMFRELSKTLFETMEKLEDTIEVTNLLHRYTLDAIGRPWIPFNTGGRKRLDMNFSLTEQHVILLMLLRKCKRSLAMDSPYRDQILNITFKNKNN
ncbi:hypothetical protein A0J61_03112 [Choanephora cucurbitarum]|uniref:Cytochrome P450 n=1 Tax=Choanephora cucurbitarum TaxID=101091 RepID=A0A1C7NIJ3_9FUNG|nr:hypothetical protein A0J61_03112 [Choanephora cucurbitarum]